MKRLILTLHLVTIVLATILLVAGCSSIIPSGKTENPVTRTTIPALTTTPIPVPTLTKTPFSSNTLTPPEREKFVRESILDSSNCRLPCWWGITPGKTTWPETEELLHYLGSGTTAMQGYGPNTILHGTGGFDFEGISIKNGIFFQETDGVVNAILVNSDGYNKLEEFQDLWNNYSPKTVLETYGLPDRVWLNVTEPYGPVRGYHLWFFYDKLGFMIRYPGDVMDAPILHICPVIEGMRAIDLSLQAPDSLLPLERFDAILEDIRLGTETGKTRVLHPIQDATGLDEKKFYDIFMQEDQPCFDTPADIWVAR